MNTTWAAGQNVESHNIKKKTPLTTLTMSHNGRVGMYVLTWSVWEAPDAILEDGLLRLDLTL